MNIENNQIDEKTPESNAGDKKSGNKLKIWLRVISVALLLAPCITAFFKFEMYNYIPFLNRFTSDEKSEAYTFATDVKSLYEKTLNLSSVEIKSRDPIYAIELDRYVAPEPDPTKYDEKFDNYSDSTISVQHTVEWMHDSKFHFIEIRIKHPSQFRMALAKNKYGRIRRLPSLIAQEVNAVVAVNGCFYNKRPGGVIIHRRQILRNIPYGVDVLLIDSNGDFHIIDDRKLGESDLLEKYDIVNAVSFGPELVHDGEALTITKRNWEPTTCEPRTAICQYDDSLHYLICLAEGRNRYSLGVTMQVFADEIAAKGVKTAYNLDGGQSGTIVIGNQLKNRVGWGPEKGQGDILYFATALEADERD